MRNIFKDVHSPNKTDKLIKKIESPMKRMSFDMDADLHHALKSYALKNRVPITELLRGLIKKELNY